MPERDENDLNMQETKIQEAICSLLGSGDLLTAEEIVSKLAGNGYAKLMVLSVLDSSRSKDIIGLKNGRYFLLVNEGTYLT